MCLGCEGLLSSNEIRTAFAAARGLSMAPSLEASNLGPFGERLDLKCSASQKYLRNARHHPRPDKSRAEVLVALKPAPASWWKLPQRLRLTCYALHPSEDNSNTVGGERKLKYARTIHKAIGESCAGKSEPEVELEATKAEPTTRDDPGQQAIDTPAELSPRDYWELI